MGIASIVLWFVNVVLFLCAITFSLGKSLELATITLFFTSFSCLFCNDSVCQYEKPLIGIMFFVASILSFGFLGYSLWRDLFYIAV